MVALTHSADSTTRKLVGRFMIILPTVRLGNSSGGNLSALYDLPTVRVRRFMNLHLAPDYTTR